MVQFIMSKNIVEPDRPQMTIWRMRIAWWIPKARITHSEYVTIMDFPLQQRVHERAFMVGLYVHWLSCYIMPKTLCVCVCACVRIYVYIKNKCKNEENFLKIK